MFTLRALTDAARIQGDPEAAIRYAEEAYGYAVEGISPEEGCAVLINLGAARSLAGDVGRGRDEICEGIRRAERTGEQAEAANGYLILSEIARRDHDLAAARALLESALALVEPRALQAGFTETSARTFSLLGCLTEQESERPSASTVTATRTVSRSAG
jgi:tetratricopeptide (TPR) repeat protein